MWKARPKRVCLRLCGRATSSSPVVTTPRTGSQDGLGHAVQETALTATTRGQSEAAFHDLRLFAVRFAVTVLSPPATTLFHLAQLAQQTAVVRAYPLLDEAPVVVEAEDVDQVEDDAFAVG